MTSERKQSMESQRVVIIDPVGPSKYAKVVKAFDRDYESLGYDCEPGEYQENQSPQDPSSGTPGLPLQAGKVYEIVLPEDFDHNDYGLFGPIDPDENPKF